MKKTRIVNLYEVFRTENYNGNLWERTFSKSTQEFRSAPRVRDVAVENSEIDKENYHHPNQIKMKNRTKEDPKDASPDVSGNKFR